MKTQIGKGDTPTTMNTAYDAATVRLKREMAEELKKFCDEIRSTNDMEASENLARTIGLKFGALLMEEGISRRGTGYSGEFAECEECGGKHRCVDIRIKTFLTVVGEVCIPRAYYPPGKDCGACAFPLDKELGLIGFRTSPGLRRSMAWMAAMDPFGKAEQAFLEVAGVRISKTAIWMTSEKIGAVLAKNEEQSRQDAINSPQPVTEAPAVPRLYGTLDAAKIHLEEGWKDIKVMAWYEPDEKKQDDSRDRAKNVTYRARLEPAEEFGEFFWDEARRRGVEKALELIILGDGALWIWNLVAHHFPAATQIVDYYHAREHLWAVGKALFGEGTPETEKWIKTVKPLLKAGKIEELIKTFENLRPVKREVREIVRLNIGYFRENKDRMRYADFRKKGYHIGSGIVEGACKHLIGQRQKGPGMIWSPTGAQAIASLRSSFLSHDRQKDIDRALRVA